MRFPFLVATGKEECQVVKDAWTSVFLASRVAAAKLQREPPQLPKLIVTDSLLTQLAVLRVASANLLAWCESLPDAPTEFKGEARVLVDQLLATTGTDPEHVKLLVHIRHVFEMPLLVEAALAASTAAETVSANQSALDRALYQKVSAGELQGCLGSIEPTWGSGHFEAVSALLDRAQRDSIERLRKLGLRRISPTAGSSFQTGRVLDSGEAGVLTRNPDWHQRVAGVEPGCGGYELAGQVLCPTRARRYEYSDENQTG